MAPTPELALMAPLTRTRRRWPTNLSREHCSMAPLASKAKDRRRSGKPPARGKPRTPVQAVKVKKSAPSEPAGPTSSMRRATPVGTAGPALKRTMDGPSLRV
eukprot:16443825-Heterocapsa_arctica.AAC.2